MRDLANELRQMGHEVSTRWLETNFETDARGRSATAPAEYRAKYAEIDMEDVRAADCVINFTEPPDDGGRGGRHVEFGFAVALGKRLIVVGYRENLFHHLPVVEFYSSKWDMLRAIATCT